MITRTGNDCTRRGVLSSHAEGSLLCAHYELDKFDLSSRSTARTNFSNFPEQKPDCVGDKYSGKMLISIEGVVVYTEVTPRKPRSVLWPPKAISGTSLFRMS